MRQVYIKRVVRTEPATPTHYTYDLRVAPGKILVLRALSASYSGIKTSETAQFFVHDAGQDVYLHDDAPERTSGHPSWTGQVAIGEGDIIGLFTPDSEALDIIEFAIFAELWDANEWRRAAIL